MMSRRRFVGGAGCMAAGAAVWTGLERGWGQMGAAAGSKDAYAVAKPLAAGPFQATWESLRDGYRVPTWFNEAKFGIFIHWGLYSIPARINEWYERHMYQSDVAWHTARYGAPDKFGYKDFIPMFTAEKYRPEEWAELFARAGAKYVVPVAEHHDGFAMWDSEVTPWCAGKMGPKRDLTGELAKAVKARGMVFGVSSHRMEHDSFAYPAAGVANDEFDPRWAGFYGPPVPGEFNNSNASKAFQEDWLARVQELVDKYEPQMIYFDNGVNTRAYDEVKLRAAAYYYNRAAEWGNGAGANGAATLATKDVAYLFGSVQDFEKMQRAPRAIYNAAGWQVDDAIGSTWGYTESPQMMTVRTAASVVRELVEIASMGGNLLLNISPKGDGSIPAVQQEALIEVGSWLKAYGEGIYGSRAWVKMGEGPMVPAESPGDWKGGSTAVEGPKIGREQMVSPGEGDFRFTVAKGALWVWGYRRPKDGEARVVSLAAGKARVERVSYGGAAVRFRQTGEGLMVVVPEGEAGMMYGLKVEGMMPLGVMG